MSKRSYSIITKNRNFDRHREDNDEISDETMAEFVERESSKIQIQTRNAALANSITELNQETEALKKLNKEAKKFEKQREEMHFEMFYLKGELEDGDMSEIDVQSKLETAEDGMEKIKKQHEILVNKIEAAVEEFKDFNAEFKSLGKLISGKTKNEKRMDGNEVIKDHTTLFFVLFLTQIMSSNENSFLQHLQKDDAISLTILSELNAFKAHVTTCQELINKNLKEKETKTQLNKEFLTETIQYFKKCRNDMQQCEKRLIELATPENSNLIYSTIEQHKNDIQSNAYIGVLEMENSLLREQLRLTHISLSYSNEIIRHQENQNHKFFEKVQALTNNCLHNYNMIDEKRKAELSAKDREITEKQEEIEALEKHIVFLKEVMSEYI